MFRVRARCSASAPLPAASAMSGSRALIGRGRAPKARGYYHEKRMEAALKPFGFRRMPMSGALGGDHAGDLRRPIDDRALRVLEVKRRSGGQRLLRRWLVQGGAQGVLLPGDRGQDALAVLPLELFRLLLGEAGYVSAKEV